MANSSLSIYKNNNNESLIFVPFSETLSISIKNKKAISISITKSDPIPNTYCGFGEIENAQSISHESVYDLESNTLTVLL